MKSLGLLGYPLTHSFSRKYFADKFSHPDLVDWSYENFEMEHISDFEKLIQSRTDVFGLNVTIPHKETVIQFLDDLDTEAREIAAVNTILIKEGKCKGYNTDVYGFEFSLRPLIENRDIKALVMGTGGAAKAVHFVLNKLDIPFKKISRSKEKGDLTYNDLDQEILAKHQLLINTTPLGMYPNIDAKPELPYQFLNDQHILYDLLYNPAITAFLQEGLNKNCVVENGLKMLELQAEKSWQIWQDNLR